MAASTTGGQAGRLVCGSVVSSRGLHRPLPRARHTPYDAGAVAKKRGRIRREPPTIGDVARLAGVGIATASRALTGAGPISADARARVLGAAAELGYRANPTARILRGAPAKTIGVMVPALYPLYTEWLRGASEAAQQHGYVLLVCDGQNSVNTMEAQLERLLTERVDGLLLAGEVLALRGLLQFMEAGVPIGPDFQAGSGRVPRFEAERAAARTAFERLVALGHRCVGFVARKERDLGIVSPLHASRVQCLREVMQAAGIDPSGALVLEAATASECASSVQELLRSKTATALIAGGLAFTAPILRALWTRELEVPTDVSVLAFNESDWEEIFRPGISVVRHSYFAVAHAETIDLIARIEQWPQRAQVQTFPSEFVERGSLGPAR